VPKLPRISGHECVATLQRMGFIQVRQKGSHVIMRRGDRGTVVPLHRELKIGTFSGILRQAGIESEEFIRFYRG
jgi:predicted RNA binding protein YcfA (HicA-like mRNA interferase family)